MALPSETTRLLASGVDEPLRDDLDPLKLTRANRTGILAGIWTATFLASINTTLVATLLTSISSEYDSANEASWLGTSYLLATATFTPLYGRLSNVLGRRGANQLAVFLLFLGTLGCGVATSMRGLILARFIAGAGGGGIFTTASIITSDLYDMRSRSLTQGIASIFSGLGMGIGGPLGGWLSDRYGWRWAFLLQLPIFFVSFALTQYHVRYLILGKVRTPLEILLRIDFLGSLTLFLTLFSSLIGLSLRYNQDFPWTDWCVRGCLVGTIGGFGVFFVVELWWAKEPVMAPWLLRRRVPMLVALSSGIVPMCNFCVMYFFPLFFEIVVGKSSTEAGAHLMPNSISMALGSLFAGFVMHRTGRYKTLNLVFGILPFLATLLIIRLRPESGFFTQWLSIIPLGFGNAVVLQTTLIALLVSIDHTHMAIGTGFVQLFRGIGQVSGVAVPSAIFQSLLRTELERRITGPGSAELIQKIRHNSRVVSTLPPELQKEVREAFGIGLKAVFVFGSVCTFIAFIVRLGIPEQSLDREPPSEDPSDANIPSSSVASSRRASLDEGEGSGESVGTAIATIPAPDLAPPLSSGFSSALSSSFNSSGPQRIRPTRRLSMLESDDGTDPEPELVPRSWRSGGDRDGRRISRQSSGVFGSWRSERVDEEEGGEV